MKWIKRRYYQQHLARLESIYQTEMQGVDGYVEAVHFESFIQNEIVRTIEKLKTLEP